MTTKERPMITNITLENFKCFQQVSINPKLVTLFIGPNGTREVGRPAGSAPAQAVEGCEHRAEPLSGALPHDLLSHTSARIP